MAKKRKRTAFSDSYMLNQATLAEWKTYLQNICLNVFRYENVPDSINTRFMELQLMAKGYCVYFNDEILGNLCLPCTIGGQLDVYNIPIERRAYATNGYYRELDRSNSVIIFNNYMHTPEQMYIELTALRLTNIQRSIDVNCENQKFPFIIITDQTQKLTVENAFEQVSGNRPVIIADKNFNIDSIRPYDLAVPFVAPQLHAEMHNTLNDFLTHMGVENANQEKKERMIASEIGANYGNVEMAREVRISARREALEEINKMFGTDIKVSYNSDLQTMLNYPNISGRGYDPLEQLYDDNQRDNRISNTPINRLEAKSD